MRQVAGELFFFFFESFSFYAFILKENNKRNEENEQNFLIEMVLMWFIGKIHQVLCNRNI